MSQGIMRDLFRRRVPQILGIYLGGAWGAVEFMGFLVDRYELSPRLLDLAVSGLVLMIPTVLLLAYFHGKPGADAWTKIEKIAIPANVMLAVSVVTFMAIGTDRNGRPTVAQARTEKQMTFTSDVRSVALSPDGETVAFLTAYDPEGLPAGEAFKLYVQDVTGGEPIELAEAVHGEPRWTQDGSRVLVQLWRRGLALNSIPRMGGNAAHVCCSGSGTLSHDYIPGTSTIVITVWHAGARTRLYVGTQPASLEYACCPLEVDTVHADGRLIDLASHVADLEFVEASPDGRWIAFLATDSKESWVLGTVSVDGTSVNVYSAISGLDSESRPRWAPSAAAIYFMRREGRGSTLYAAKINRRNGSLAGEPEIIEVGYPVVFGWDVSLTGTRLVVSGGNGSPQLRLARAEPGDASAVKVDLTDDAYSYRAPAFSPDGDSLAYVKTAVDGASDIYIRHRDRGGERNVTMGRLDAGAVETLNWSPDGRRLAALSRASADSMALFIIDLSSNRFARIWTDDVAGPILYTTARQVPAWSPDGGKLLLLLRQRSQPVMIDAATGRADDWIAEGYGPGGFGSDPVFSPAGSRITLFSGTNRIHDLDGSLVTSFSKAPVDGKAHWCEPVLWAPDGHIYTIMRPPLAMHRINPENGSHELHARMPFQCWSQIAMTPDARNIACAVPDVRSDIFVIDHFDPGIAR